MAQRILHITMVDIEEILPEEGGFDRSNKLDDICEEFARLARLKIAEEVKATVEDGRERVFGAVVSGDKVRYTESLKGNKGSIPGSQIKVVKQGVEKMAGEGDTTCMIHTHPGEPSASGTDFVTMASSLTERDSPLGDRRGGVFDCFFIIGRLEEEVGEIRGYIIRERPDNPKEIFDAVEQRKKEVSREVKFPNQIAEAVREELFEEWGANKYMDRCRGEFSLNRPGM